MPTYDYECQNCHNKFELFTRIHDTASKACPRCGKKRAKRLIGAGAGFIFKGGGFYVTDSRSSSSGGDPAAAKSDAKSASKDSKPAKKSD